MNKKEKLLICCTTIEILCESTSSDSSDKEEFLQLTYTCKQNIRPRITNYFSIVNEYSNNEFKSHFR